MSSYYDPDKPFSITNWNTLIGDVNDILQNPPADSPDCLPIDPIDEVEDPHIWAVEDIEEVHDKLIETCPDIFFSEELVMWEQGIIDEIEEKMSEAWCDCEEGEPVECGTFDWELTLAAARPTFCCGDIFDDFLCGPSCLGQVCRQTQVQGEYYAPPDNVSTFDTICENSDKAYDAVSDYITATNALKPIADLIEEYQADIDGWVSEMIPLIAYSEANCVTLPVAGDCAAKAAEICNLGTQARAKQDLLDAQVELFATKHAERVAAEEEANDAAADNWAATLDLIGRFPADVNIWNECVDDHFTGFDGNQEPWGKWWNPNRDDVIGNIGDLYWNRASDSGEGVLPAYWIYYQNARHGDTKLLRNVVRVSPDGTPYVSGHVAQRYNRNYSLTYLNRRIRTRCSIIFVCVPTPGMCVWNEWSEYENVYWNQGWPMTGSCVVDCSGFFCWIYAPLPPPDWDLYPSDTVYLEFDRPRRNTTDFTEEQDEWFDEHLNWYDEHPQYDDRHESYC